MINLISDKLDNDHLLNYMKIICTIIDSGTERCVVALNASDVPEERQNQEPSEIIDPDLQHAVNDLVLQLISDQELGSPSGCSPTRRCDDQSSIHHEITTENDRDKERDEAADCGEDRGKGRDEAAYGVEDKDKERVEADNGEDGDKDDGDETDIEIWAGKKKEENRLKDDNATCKLLEVIKENWKEFSNSKSKTREELLDKIALEVRGAGVKIPRDRLKSRNKVSSRWKKLRESYFNFIDSATRKTGKGVVHPPKFYKELHGMLGTIVHLFVGKKLGSHRVKR